MSQLGPAPKTALPSRCTLKSIADFSMRSINLYIYTCVCINLHRDIYIYIPNGEWGRVDASHVAEDTMRYSLVGTVEQTSGQLRSPKPRVRPLGGSTGPDGDSPRDTILTVRAACHMSP